MAASSPEQSERSPADAAAPSHNKALGQRTQGFSFALERDASDRLALRALHRPDWEALRIDWLSADVRRRVLAGKRQLLPRALGLHKKTDLIIADATAGLGRDGFTLAALGARVIMIEREPLLVTLLRDAVEKTCNCAERWASQAAGRIEVVESDARDWLRNTATTFDAVHLDPMYPDDGKAALPQKAMQMLRELTHDDDDAPGLLQAARNSAASRVAVKRPTKAPWLAEQRPDATVSATQARYDIYLNPR